MNRSFFAIALLLPALGLAVEPVLDLEPTLRAIRDRHGLPALAGAIVTANGLVVQAAVGVRKVGTDVPVTIADQWHLGSDTKAMTATLIGTLVEQGKLRWDTTLAVAFPALAPEMPQGFRDLTLLHLLSHRSGLPANLDYRAVGGNGTMRERRLAVVKAAMKLELSAPAGTQYSYSNLGYMVAGAAAEQAGDAAWEDLIAARLFVPLGMSAGFGGTGTPGQLDQPWGHLADGKPVAGNGPAMDNPAAMGPAGTVHATLADWGRFIADQLRGAEGTTALLKPETYRTLHTPPFGGDYALGWLIAQRPWGGGAVLTHAGTNTMNYAVAWLAPKRDFAVLICANQGGDKAAAACDDAAGKLIELYTPRTGK